MPDKTIFSDTKAFTQKLYDTLNSLDSQTLLDALKAAKQIYCGCSYMKSSLVRLKTMLKNIRALPDSKLEFVGIFFSSGAWERYSANTLVMIALINLTDHKRTKEETDSYLHEKIVQGLSKGLRMLIHTGILYTGKTAKDSYREQQDRLKSLIFTVPKMPDVLLAGSREEGALLKKNNPEKYVYALSERRLASGNSSWELTWFDERCSPAYLRLSPRLSALLNTLTSFKLPEPGDERYDQLKFCCHELFPAHSDVYLFDDRDTARAFASLHTDKFVFCLNAVEQNASSSSSSSSSSNTSVIKWKLTCYDRNGREKLLLISPGIARMLSRQDAQFDLCSYAGFQIKQYCHSVADDLLRAIHVVMAPKPDDLTSVYVIEGSKLTWHGSIGQGHDVDVKDFPALADWLAGNPGRTGIRDDERVYLKTLLRHVYIQRDVDPEKQSLVKNNALKHLNLKLPFVATNNLAALPRFRLIPETWYLVRENLDSSRDWVLYLRRKGLPGNPSFMEKINTEDWKTFHETLQQNDVMPESLSASAIESLQNSILNYSDVEKQSKNTCFVVADLGQVDPQRERSDSFLLSKSENGWSIAYVNSLQRLLPVEWQTLPDVAAVVQTLPDESAALNREHLAALTDCLSRHKPSSRLKMDQFSNIEAYFRALTSEGRAAGSVAAEAAGSLPPVAEEVPPRESVKTGKFASQFAAMEAFFSPRRAQAPKEDLIASQSHTP
ncbi:hypothetical protein [Legionella sp. CNM-4043-24]|uniref:hypothetical protein n=1 Tax=Legionella sp. CNM-4043-24 TaxID=3421646 RepID=UPI00403B003B